MNTTQELIQDIKAGKMVILMDDEDRENEGDLVLAAQAVTESHINFMAQYGRGLICMPMTEHKCRQLELPLMVNGQNQSKFGTNFTVSIEAATGVSTGISVPDRTRTIQVAAQNDAGPSDIAQPGHIFPIMAQPGGVLVRSGHTEASCDLAKLAGFSPVAVICEILNQDGTMARRPELEVFAKEHNLKIGTIEDIIRYRLEKEKTVALRVSNSLDTQWGTFKLSAFESLHDKAVHTVLQYGEPKPGAIVRVQPNDALFDLPGVRIGHWDSTNPRWPLSQAMQAIAEHGSGAIVMLAAQSSSAQLLEDIGMLSNKANTQNIQDKKTKDWRMIGVGSQILSQLGFTTLKLLGGPKKFHGLSGFGLEVIEYLPYNEHSN